MNLLAIDTSFSISSVAISSAGKISSFFRKEVRQSGHILNMIDELLKSVHLKMSDLHAIAVGVGPGSFTGIRVAVSVAQGLGFATGLPIIPISSLAVLAQSAYERHGWSNIITAIDARMNEVYWALWTVDMNRVRLIGEETISTPSMIEFPEESGWCGIGDVWTSYDLQTPSILDTDKWPLAVPMLSLATPLLHQQKWVSAQAVAPVYLREMAYPKEKKRIHV